MSVHPPLTLTLAVYEAIRDSIGYAPAEVGGMLGGDFDKKQITHFYYDKKASRSAAVYSPDIASINNLLTDEWNPTSVRLFGFVHSHPPGICQPSRGDEIYAERILRYNIELPFLALPIVQSLPDADQFQIRMFVARRTATGIKIDREAFLIAADSDECCGYIDFRRLSGVAPRPAPNARDNKELAELTCRSLNQNGGVTIDLSGYEPRQGFVFCPNKSSETKIPAKDFTLAAAEAFVHEHWQELNQAGVYIGAWKDTTGTPTLDVSRVSTDKLDALLRARDAQQDAIHNLQTQENIAVKNGLSEFSAEEIAKAERRIAGKSAPAELLAEAPAGRNASAVCSQTARTNEACGTRHPLVKAKNSDAGSPVQPRPERTAPPRSTSPPDSAFARVESVYDLKHLATCRVIYIGMGGAAGYAEDMARTGVREHVIIDPDVVCDTNLATQQVYLKDIGRAKVTCVAERIRQINDAASVIGLQKSVDDLSDKAFRELAFAQMPGNPPPKAILLCGLTDSFEAQARVNRIGLNFGLPTLCAQVYAEGRAAEVTFTYPGVTPACHRCILSSRYDAYLNKGYQNDVTSNGTPIFATTRLNAIKGFIALAILHHGRSHPRWGSMLARIGNRNLIQIRLDPDVESSLGLQNFEQAFGGANREHLFFDETIWRPQLQESPSTGYVVACPDCGGTGDLRSAIARFADTRLMPISHNELIESA